MGPVSSLFKKRGVWNISLYYKGRRIKRSLSTTSYQKAKALKKKVEQEIIQSLNDNSYDIKLIPFPALCDKFLKAPHELSPSTIKFYKKQLKRFLTQKQFPENPTYRQMIYRSVNKVISWGLENNYKTDQVKFSTKEVSGRTRTFSDKELHIILNEFRDVGFQRFIRFMYYTGIRIGEACNLKEANLKKGMVTGKTGNRQIKITLQAKKVLEEQYADGGLWTYTVDSAEARFRNNRIRLDLKDVRVQDIRRTFGYNLLKKGLDILKLSKLLGHKNVTTTVKHYAPITLLDIDDFTL